MKNIPILCIIFFLGFGTIYSQEEEQEEKAREETIETDDGNEGQSRDSKAMDATATQWSFQMAYQWMPQYHDDIVNGELRKKGLDNYAQLRIVAPVPLKSMTILPRLTVRHYEDLENGKSGFGNTEFLGDADDGHSSVLLKQGDHFSIDTVELFDAGYS